MLAALLTMTAYAMGIFLICRTVPAGRRLAAIATLPVGWISICALAGCLETLTGLPAQWTLIVAVGGMLIAVIMMIRSRCSEQNFWRLPRRELTLQAAVLFMMVVFSCVASVAIRLEPWGNWDSMFTWVLRARFLFVGGDQWANTFSHDLALLHPDYPPMLGWALFALWRLDGAQLPSAVNWLCLPVWPAFVLLVLSWQAQSQKSGRWRLTITVAALLATPILWRLAASRLADFILAYAILASALWWEWGRQDKRQSDLVLAGWITGWAGLIKNEGLLWMLAFSLGMGLTWVFRRFEKDRQPVWPFAAGLAIPLFAILLFKTLAAPPSDLASPMRNFEIGELVQPGTLINPGRLLIRIDQAFHPLWHLLIWMHVWDMLQSIADWGITLWLIPVLIIFRRHREIYLSPVFWAVLIQACGYYFVYLITPYHPYWHLSTSLSRISAHIVPVLVCLLAFVPDRPPSAVIGSPRWIKISRAGGVVYLILFSCLNLGMLGSGEWKLGQQPAVQLDERARIDFPGVDKACYVSDEFGIQDLYATQFNFVPTVLMVDRREDVLLARFSNEAALRLYCEQQGWLLQRNVGGLGWAKNGGGEGLRQPVTVAPLR